MTPRRIILGLIVLTTAVFCLLAAVKLRATPQYDKVQLGMSLGEVMDILGSIGLKKSGDGVLLQSVSDEGTLLIQLNADQQGELRVADKRIEPRGPLDRLSRLAGWELWPPASVPMPTSNGRPMKVGGS